MSYKCIVHYSMQKSNPNKVTKVDKTRFDKLIKAKSARVKSGGAYFHQLQCENIPNQFVEGFAYHRECYNKFTRAINGLRKEKNRLLQNHAPFSPAVQLMVHLAYL